MENLINRLQNEASLSEEQAVNVVSIVKDFMDKEGLDINWNKFFKGKYEDFAKRSQSFIKETGGKMDSFSDKLEDTAEDLATEAKRAARDISKKIYDKLND